MKDIFQGLLKKKISTLLVIVEIFVTLIYFISVMCALQSTFAMNIEMPKQVDCNTNEVMRIKISDDFTADKYNEFKKKLIDCGEIDSCSIFDFSYIMNEGMDEITRLDISKDSEYFKKFIVEDGRELEAEDFKHGDKACVLIGKNVAQENGYSVGDTILDLNENEYTVVGILKEEQTTFFQDFDEGILIQMDDAVIYPVNEQNMDDFYTSRLFCKLKDKKDASSVKNTAEIIAKELDVAVECEVMSDVLKESFDKSYDENKSWIIMSAIIIVLNCAGVTSIIVSWVYSRKFEIGLRIALGYSKKSINRIFIGEVIVIGGISTLLACIAGKIMYSNQDASFNLLEVGNYMSGKIVLATILIATLTILPPIIAVLCKLKKLQPTKLIGGKE